MRLIINAAFALTLVAFAAGVFKPFNDPRLDQMRTEFAAFHWSGLFGGPQLRGGFVR